MGTFVIYSGYTGDYRWYLIDEDNHKVADSVDSYDTRQECEHAILLMRRLASLARVLIPPRVETLLGR